MLRAATDSFLARGYASSVEDIARRAGVAKQTVYSHFPSKDVLFREVARGLAMSVLVELEGGDPRAALTLAGTYDPIVLEKLGIQGFASDIAAARTWYERAKEFGSAEALRRLEMLASRTTR